MIIGSIIASPYNYTIIITRSSVPGVGLILFLNS